METEEQNVIVRRFFNQTDFFIQHPEERRPILHFKMGLMMGVVFITDIPVISLQEEGRPRKISVGGLLGKKLLYRDSGTFTMPSEVKYSCHVSHDYRSRRFFNNDTGDEIHCAHYALFTDGSIEAGWIQES